MLCWGELKSLRGQSVGEVRLVMRAIFRICGNESQPGLQLVEKLSTPLTATAEPTASLTRGHISFCKINALNQGVLDEYC